MGLEGDNAHINSQEETPESHEHNELPTSDHPADDEGPSKRLCVDSWTVGNKKEPIELCSGQEFVVDLDVVRQDGVYYNTVRPITPRGGKPSSFFESDIVQRDPTRHIPKNPQGMWWLQKKSIHQFTKMQKLVWLTSRFEAISNMLAAGGNSMSRIRSGMANITKHQLLKLLKDDLNKVFGHDKIFVIGVPYLQIPPFSFFIKREELTYFGICQDPYETVSVSDLRDGTQIAQAIILDGAASLRSDMGIRFVFYCPFEKSGTESNSCDDANQAIFQSWIHEVPIRVVRVYNAVSRYAPIWGHRYDGVYRIIAAFSDNNKQGVRVWAYVFSACDPFLEPPVVTENETELDFNAIGDVELRTTLTQNYHLHVKVQKGSVKKRDMEDLKHVDVGYRSKKLFTIAVPYFVRVTYKGRVIPLLVNFVTIYCFIKKVCIAKNISKDWLQEVAALYEEAKRVESKVWWARGGFLPMKLVITHSEPVKRLKVENCRGQNKEKITKTRMISVKSLAINREMAKCLCRPYFPQSDTDVIATSIDLSAPMSSDWNPYNDISAGDEVHPIPVVNTVDNEEPPMCFTYIAQNTFLSRLPALNFDPVCAGCVPEGLDRDECEQVVVKGFCKGLIDKKGRLFCLGVNKEYLSTIQSRAACSDNCPCSKDCINRLLDGVQVPVKLVKTVNMGWSLHCMVSIAAGTYIMQYVGEVICRKEMMAREHQYDKLGRFNYCMEAVEMETLHDDWQMPCMDSMVLGNIARFLNHSCEPNVEVITVWRGDDFPCIAVYALRDIEADEALTYCYGPQYKNIPCLCESSNCKGFIGNI